MSEKKYSDEDVKRIVQEALRQSKEREEDDRRIIEETIEESKEAVQEDDEWATPSHWKKPDNNNPNKPIIVKDKTLSEMRTGCTIIILSGILFIIAMVAFLVNAVG